MSIPSVIVPARAGLQSHRAKTRLYDGSGPWRLAVRRTVQIRGILDEPPRNSRP